MSISKVSVLILFLFPFGQLWAQSNESLLSKTNLFFNNYVNSGLVDYALVKDNVEELNELLSIYNETNFTDVLEKKAMLINLYNLGAIKLLVDNYPVGGPQEITGFYEKKFLGYNGEKLSLNELENNIIRKQYHDPRVHFVLVCGALGCPPITNFAYDPAQLDEQMTQQTIQALNNEGFLSVVGNTVLLSEIFKWYKNDFIENNKTVLEYINQYRKEAIDEKSNIEYYTYNWEINDIKNSNPKLASVVTEMPKNKEKKKTSTQEFTPSVLYTKGQWEFKHFNNLYSQTAGFDANRNIVDFNSRGNYFSSINQALFGVNSRINVGFDFWIKSVRIDDASSSPFATLSFQNNMNSRTAISGIGPKIKVQPFKRLSHLSVQSTFLFPVAKDQEGIVNGKPYLSQDSYISINQIFYDQAITRKLQMFLSFSPWVYIKKEAQENTSRLSLSSPVDVFLSYFPSQRLTFYTQQGYWPNYGLNGVSSWFRQEGLGAKYQIVKGKLEIESSYTKFTMGKNQGAGATYNFGLRLMHL